MSRTAVTTERDGALALLLGGGTLLVAVPEPTTSFLGTLLVLAGVAGWLGGRLR